MRSTRSRICCAVAGLGVSRPRRFRRAQRFNAASRGLARRPLRGGGSNHALVMRPRETEGRRASPSAGVIDRLSVKTTESGGERGFADGAHAGEKLAQPLRRLGRWSLEIVKRPQGAKGFLILPRRWVVERILAKRHTHCAS